MRLELPAKHDQVRVTGEVREDGKVRVRVHFHEILRDGFTSSEARLLAKALEEAANDADRVEQKLPRLGNWLERGPEQGSQGGGG